MKLLCLLTFGFHCKKKNSSLRNESHYDVKCTNSMATRLYIVSSNPFNSIRSKIYSQYSCYGFYKKMTLDAPAAITWKKKTRPAHFMMKEQPVGSGVQAIMRGAIQILINSGSSGNAFIFWEQKKKLKRKKNKYEVCTCNSGFLTTWEEIPRSSRSTK